MPEDIRDVTNQYNPPWWDAVNPLWTVKKVSQGTFCFPFGSGFGCGEEKKITTGQEMNLSVNIGAEHSGVSGGVTIGVKHSQNEEWSYKSKECEYCRPKICFPNSTLTIAESCTVLPVPPIVWCQTIEFFEPGPQGEIERNCTQNDPLCKCDKAQAALFFAPDTGGAVTRSPSPSLVMMPTGFFQKSAEPLSLDTAQVAKQISDNLNSMWKKVHARSSDEVALGILNPSGDINWLYPASPSEGISISILSRNAREYTPGGRPAWIEGRYYQFIAATQCLPKAIAKVSMVLKDPDGDIKRIESTPSVTSGLSTIIASEFDFGADGLEPGTQGLLEISLLSADDNCVLAFLSEELVVPHFMGGS